MRVVWRTLSCYNGKRMTRREEYEAVIGLEIHAQLKTRSKIFCGCSTQFGDCLLYTSDAADE